MLPLSLIALNLTTQKASVPVFASISPLCGKKTVVMVEVIEFIQRHLEVSCAVFPCSCLNGDNWKSERQAGLTSPQLSVFVLSPSQTVNVTMSSKSHSFCKDVWHRLRYLFWHIKTKYLILMALSANRFLKTQQTSSARLNKCNSSLLTDHSAIHKAVAFWNSLLSSTSFQLAMKRITATWWKVPSIWILPLLPI